ncbi:suppressor of glycerol defect [Coemansia brasiliensis]|uniref:Suppressor of glycerol defect n=1 Tax=Coemansia brasiliensis TaxID=2650707 RepID=A0A9W8I6Z0_9FUNG|nr:suppressor of glycerol defect [Coemansia brasiliensis]
MPKRRLQPNAVLPASIASQIAEKESGSQKRFTKRFKNTAGSRKAARKQARDEKKQRKNQHYKRTHGFEVPEKKEAAKSKPDTQKPSAIQPSRAKPITEEDEQKKLVKFAKRNQGMYKLLRDSNLIEDVDKEAGIKSKQDAAEELEDREMRRLEKHLGIKSNSKLGNVFFEEGLGEILEGIEFGSSNIRKASQKNDSKRPETMQIDEPESDSEKSDSDRDVGMLDSDEDADDFGLNDMEDEDSEAEDSDVAEMYRSQGIDINPSLSDISSDEDGADSNEDGVDSNEDGTNSDDNDVGSDEEDIEEPSSSESTDSSDNSDDHDSKPAENPPSASVGRYIPPSLRRKQQSEDDDERLAAIRKTLQGQLNRLSESNIEGIVLQIEAQYQKYPRHHVTQVLTDLILQSIQSRIHMLDTFLYVNAAVVGAVYRIVGLEPVAHLVQKLMELFEQRFTQGMAEFKQSHSMGDSEDGVVTSSKECQNLSVFVAELYNFQVISCQLVYDMIRMCVQEINEFTAELLLKLIRISGQQLRRDDPLALKEIVRQVTEQVGKVNKLSVRCKFMVESLTNLKDNRMRGEMSQNAENVARLKRFLGNMDKRRAVGAVEPINIGMQDIRDIETKGKWWLVGASWVGNQHGVDSAPVEQQLQTSDSSNAEMERLLQLAREQHMNTDVRRSIFVTLLSSDDYTDAFERLLKLDLKKTQSREIMRVVLHCCGQEPAYNPFYTLVAYKLCSLHNTYKLTMQYALWDFLRELGESDVGGLGQLRQESSGVQVPLRRMVNLAKMFAWLIDKHELSLLILKTVTFARVGEQARIFFQILFTTLFLLHKKRTDVDEQSLHNVFQRAASNPTMCHGILFFFHHFVRDCDLVAKEDLPVVKWGCKVAKRAIRSSIGSSTFDF